MLKVHHPFYCNGCRLQVDQAGEECPRCHYPLDPIKEEPFLLTAISGLQRVATYGGARLRVVDLLRLYQLRLDALHQRQTAEVTAPATPPVAIVPRPVITATLAQVEVPGRPESALPVALGSSPSPYHMFSWRSFFADQFINIMASLGAFLILIGALSFTSTTSNLSLAFFVVFAVHAFFGLTGFVTYRFASFRVVAIVYTIIYALLVPLVGFSVYRLIAGNVLNTFSAGSCCNRCHLCCMCIHTIGDLPAIPTVCLSGDSLTDGSLHGSCQGVQPRLLVVALNSDDPGPSLTNLCLAVNEPAMAFC